MNAPEVLDLVRAAHPEVEVDVALRVHGFPNQWLVRDTGRTVAFVAHAVTGTVNPVDPAVAIVTVEPGGEPGALGLSWWRGAAA